MPVPPASLAATLRLWRDRLDPADVGLPAAGDRRARGLRREELALLAGVSVDYLVRLEQGRAEHPSRQVAQALARALQLTTAERDHLFAAAGLQPPSAGLVPSLVPPGVARLVARLRENPVAVYAADWTLLDASPLFTALVAVRGEPNLARQAFDLGRGGPSRILPEDPARLRAAIVSDLRATLVRYPDDPRLAELVAFLRASSTEFESLWRQGRVVSHESERKTIPDTPVGDVTLDCDVLTAPGSDVRIIAYSAAAGTREADQLALLRSLGPAAGTTPATDVDPEAGIATGPEAGTGIRTS